MQDNYWSKFAGRRIGRRQAIAATGSVAAAAAFLAACGGDDDDDGGSTGGTSPTAASGGGGGGATPSGGGGAASSGLLTDAVYTAPAQAKRGGVLNDLIRGSMRNIDPISGQAGLNDVADRVMSSLFTETPGKLERSGHVIQGDLVDSWEVSGDGLQATLKLRQGVKWHDIAPVSGRAFDSGDVLAAFQRYGSIGALGSSIFKESGPGGFVDSYNAPDDSTVVLNFAESLAWGLNWFAPFGGYTATLLMTPKESDNGFDQAQTMIGTGPFQVAEYEPSVRVDLKRNPDYWDPDWALVDEIKMPILPEYATRQAAYKAGDIDWAWQTTLVVRPTDVLNVINDQPKLNLHVGRLGNTGSTLTYGIQTMVDGKNPFEDERVRQAISKAYDRDLDNDVQFNVEEFTEAGLPIETFWNSHLATRDSFAGGGWVLDPRGSEMGENAKFFQYDVAEGKKLLAAAGYPDGFEVGFRYPHASAFSRETRVEPLFGFVQSLGINVVQTPQTDYTGEYIPENRDASGAYPGIAYHSITGGIPSQVDPSAALNAEHNPTSGVTFHGYGADGQGDPALVEILNKMKAELDTEARKSLNHEAQRYLAKAQWNMLEAGTATSFVSAWPAVGNFGVWQAAPSTWRTYQIFIDDTKAPRA